MNAPLEGYKSFTVVAWITVIGFSIFTFYLVTELNQKVDRIAEENSIEAQQQEYGIGEYRTSDTEDTADSRATQTERGL